MFHFSQNFVRPSIGVDRSRGYDFINLLRTQLDTKAELDAALATFTSFDKNQFCDYINSVSSSEYLTPHICHSAYPRTFPSLSG